MLRRNGVVDTVIVDLGLMNNRYAEVRSGLNEGDMVITGSTADALPAQKTQQQGLLSSGKS